MPIHTIGEHMDFHLDLHALVAEGLFVRSGLWHVLPDMSFKPLEGLFRARVITFFVEKSLLPPERAGQLRGGDYSGFNAHRSRRVRLHERENLEHLAQYINGNPFAVEKVPFSPPNRANPEGSVLYRSGLNPKIQRNFEVMGPLGFHPPSLCELRRTSRRLAHRRPRRD